MLKILLLSLVLLAIVLAQKEQEAACIKEVSAKVRVESDFGLRLAVLTGMALQGLGDENGMQRIVDGLTVARKERVRNYYLIGACLPFQSRLH